MEMLASRTFPSYFSTGLDKKHAHVRVFYVKLCTTTIFFKINALKYICICFKRWRLVHLLGNVVRLCLHTRTAFPERHFQPSVMNTDMLALAMWPMRVETCWSAQKLTTLLYTRSMFLTATCIVLCKLIQRELICFEPHQRRSECSKLYPC